MTDHLYAPSAAWLTDAHRTEPCRWCHGSGNIEEPQDYGVELIGCPDCQATGIGPVVPQPLTAPHPIPQGATVEYVVPCLRCWTLGARHRSTPRGDAPAVPAIVGRSVVTACKKNTYISEWWPDQSVRSTYDEFAVEVSPVEWYPTPHTAMACPECDGEGEFAGHPDFGTSDDVPCSDCESGVVPVPTLTEGLWL